MRTIITVLVTFADMLRALPDNALQAEVEKREGDITKRVAPTKADYAALLVNVKESDMLAALDDEAIGKIAFTRGIDGAHRDDAIHDAVKEIDRAVKAGDMMHYRILMNRLAPNAVIL